MKTILLVGLLLTSALASASDTQGNVYAIIAGDTTDPSIGDSTKADINTITKELNAMQKSTGMQVNVVTITDQKNLADNVWDVVTNLNVQPDDVIFFYYSGHGFREKNKDPNPWPYIYFNLDDSYLDYAQIISELQNKDPRLLVTMVDVCNSYIDQEQRVARSAKILTKEMKANIQKNYKKLFLEYRGHVNVTSSSSGEYSWGDSAGGLYTQKFDKALNNELQSSKSPSWQHIISETKKSIGDEEHPYSDIKLESAN